MQPFVHPVVGYVCYAAFFRWRRGDPPPAEPAVVAVVAAAIPDLIDRPLWLAEVAPVGRTIGHSLPFALPVVAAVWLAAGRRGRPALGDAFAIGYLSHVATDVPWHVLSGDYDELGFLLWPLANMPAYDGVKVLASAGPVEVTTLWLEAVVLVGGIALWWSDDRPGLAFVSRRRD